MKKKLCSVLCLLLAMALPLTGCEAEDYQEDETPWYAEENEESPAEVAETLPESFSLAIHRSQTLDPVTCSEGTQQYVGSLLYEPLFALDECFVPRNVLCESYTVSEDGLTYLFRLREGVYFGDGSELSAEDVAATLRRALTAERYASRLTDVATVSATRDGEVRVVLLRPNGGLTALLDIPIVKKGTEDELVPAGTGPYLFITDGDGAYLSYREDWWQRSAMPLERIELVDAKDTATVQHLFTSREIQLYAARLTGSTSVLTGSLDCVDAPTTIMHYIGVNSAHPLLADAAVRRSISAGIDRATVTTGFLASHARAAEFPVPPESPLYPEERELGYSFEAFQTASESAGLTVGQNHPLRLLVNTESDEKGAIAAYIAEALSEFDLRITVVTLPWQEYLAALAAGDFDLYYAEVKLSADGDVSPLFYTGGALNYGGWSSAVTDGLLDNFRMSQDREAAADALYAHLAWESVVIPVCFENLSVLTHRDIVDGMTPTAGNVFHSFKNWELHLAE